MFYFDPRTRQGSGRYLVCLEISVAPILVGSFERHSADYRKIYGHCNIPAIYSDKSKLANCVSNQRSAYRLHLEGKEWQMTTFRIQKLRRLGFEWGVYVTAC